MLTRPTSGEAVLAEEALAGVDARVEGEICPEVLETRYENGAEMLPSVVAAAMVVAAVAVIPAVFD